MGDSDRSQLETILAIWPIVSVIAGHLPVGDLISLSRTSVGIRIILHGFTVEELPHSTSRHNHRHINLRPSLQIGKHQTDHWLHLKRLSPFLCSSPTHTKGSNPHPCKNCSRPICEACVVRSSIANPNENTFKNRTRYLCPGCWVTGNLRKDYRHPASSISHVHDRIQHGKNYSQQEVRCRCTFKADAWLCIPCKQMQNTTARLNEAPSRAHSVGKGKKEQDEVMRCYGLDCDGNITADDRDRRRICLWCSKPLARQFGGEDRLRWDSKTIEVRALNAANRSADIEEWARTRFRSLTMSRRQMHGTPYCLAVYGNDKVFPIDAPSMLRHLDAINYRAFVTENEAPDNQQIWNSKNGIWKYEPELLLAIGRKYKTARKSDSNWTRRQEYLQTLTKENGLHAARTNSEVPSPRSRSEVSRLEPSISEICAYLKAWILEYYHQHHDLSSVKRLLSENHNVEISDLDLISQVSEWQDTERGRDSHVENGARPSEDRHEHRPPYTEMNRRDDGDIQPPSVQPQTHMQTANQIPGQSLSTRQSNTSSQGTQADGKHRKNVIKGISSSSNTTPADLTDASHPARVPPLSQALLPRSDPYDNPSVSHREPPDLSPTTDPELDPPPIDEYTPAPSIPSHDHALVGRADQYTAAGRHADVPAAAAVDAREEEEQEQEQEHKQEREEIDRLVLEQMLSESHRPSEDRRGGGGDGDGDEDDQTAPNTPRTTVRRSNNVGFVTNTNTNTGIVTDTATTTAAIIATITAGAEVEDEDEPPPYWP